jgi:hypothetical protein
VRHKPALKASAGMRGRAGSGKQGREGACP